MKAFREKAFASKHHSASSTDSLNLSQASTLSEKGPTDGKHAKASFWSSFVGSPFTAFDVIKESSATEKKATHYRRNGWTEAVKRLVAGGSMRRLHELILGPSRTGISNSTSHLWLLGLCYKILSEDSYDGSDNNNELAAFMQDFSSRILMTYRKGFVPIKDSKYTSDVNWGCMIRSSQMLVAQALLFHRLGRSWRRNPVKQPVNREYNEILRLFGDSEASAFSIYNLLEAGKSYGLAAGSWVGPYAMCRSWQTLAHQKKKKNDSEKNSLPMAIYVVSGDEDGERGGAPVVCIEDASRHCFEFSNGQLEWTPILLLVPLVLGLEKINPRYIPSLGATFTFPQSLGILGGKPGNSTYLVGVQDEKAFYLDPHEVQPVIDSSADNLEVDTSSYHCSTIRHVPLDSIDPSLAIGFYCRDKGDFDDFCSRATDLAAKSSGAPLFTVVGTRGSSKPRNRTTVDGDGFGEDASFDARDDDWQLL